MLREKGAVGAYSEGGILVPGAVVRVQLDLLATGMCSQARSASCASSCARLQWVTWREVDREVSEGTHWIKQEDVTGKKTQTHTGLARIHTHTHTNRTNDNKIIDLL